MKKEDLFELIGEAKPEYLAESEKPIRTGRVLRRCALAACLLLAVLVGIRLLPTGNTDGPELPMLTISENSSGGMGFEGYEAYDVSELVNANPWTLDAELKSLPVYENTLVYNRIFRVENADPDAMLAQLIKVAGQLGLDTENITIGGNTTEYDEATRQKIVDSYRKNGFENAEEWCFKPESLYLQTDGIKITVGANLLTTIRFDPPVSIPEEYDISSYAGYSEMASAAGYLYERYADLSEFKEPVLDISGGDYNIELKQSYDIRYTEGGSSLTEQIINYNLSGIRFYGDSNGDLFIIRIFYYDLDYKVGDYPVITAEEAERLLLDGHFITTVPYDFPGKEYIARVELLYRTEETSEYFMPYYRFLVELPEMENENGLKTYGAYYVPAVESRYLTNMPLWDGSFN